MRFRKYTMRKALASGWGFRMPKGTGWLRSPKYYVAWNSYRNASFSWFSFFKWLFK